MQTAETARRAGLVPAAGSPDTATSTARGRRRKRSDARWANALWLVPALAFYLTFAIYPVLQGMRYSLYKFDGISTASWVGLDNYRKVFTEPNLFGSIIHSFILILFFAVLPIVVALVTVAVLRDLRPGRFSTIARVTVFVPQVLPLVGASVVWTWIYSDTGPINAFLRAVGLGDWARAWLSDFTFALPAVGLIGAWVTTGFCTVMFLAGLGKIDTALYDAAKLDGAGAVREFTAVTLPGLRHELVVVATVTVIAALSTFDIINTATGGGPGYSTMVPGVLVVRLAFTENQVGLASALGVVLMVLVLLVVAPLQRMNRSTQ